MFFIPKVEKKSDSNYGSQKYKPSIDRNSSRDSIVKNWLDQGKIPSKLKIIKCVFRRSINQQQN